MRCVYTVVELTFCLAEMRACLRVCYALVAIHAPVVSARVHHAEHDRGLLYVIAIFFAGPLVIVRKRARQRLFCSFPCPRTPLGSSLGQPPWHGRWIEGKDMAEIYG